MSPSLKPILKLVILGVILTLTSQLVVTAQEEKPRIIINQVNDQNFPTVQLRLTALDASGLALDNLDTTNFQVWETGQAARNVSVQPVPKAEANPISVVLAMDVSGSMGEIEESNITKIEVAQAAAKTLLDNLGAQDQAALISFSETVELIQPFTTNVAALKSSVDQLQLDGDTDLYQALFDAAELTNELPIGKKVIILLTDGLNTYGNMTLDVALELAQKSGTPVYTIGYFDKSITPEILNKAEADLKRIAINTNGRYFAAPTTDSLKVAFDEIDLLLRLQYDLTFNSNLTADCQPHQLEVNVSYQGQDGQDNDVFNACPPNPAQITFVGPPEGQTIYKSNEFAVQIAPPYEIIELQIEANNFNKTISIPPFEFTWDVTQENPRVHTLKTTVTDSTKNNHIIERDYNVVAPLNVELVSPPPNEKLYGQVEVIAQVSGPGQLKTVELFWDGQSIAKSTQAKISHIVDLQTMLNGDYTISAQATELDGYIADDSQTAPVERINQSSGWGMFLILGLLGLAFVSFMILRNRKNNNAVATENAYLVVLRGSTAGFSYALDSPEITIGRSQTNQVQVEGASASRQHAVIKKFEQRYIYYNLSPHNPSIINGQTISTSYELQPNDQIEIGDTLFQFRRN